MFLLQGLVKKYRYRLAYKSCVHITKKWKAPVGNADTTDTEAYNAAFVARHVAVLLWTTLLSHFLRIFFSVYVERRTLFSHSGTLFFKQCFNDDAFKKNNASGRVRLSSCCRADWGGTTCEKETERERESWRKKTSRTDLACISRGSGGKSGHVEFKDYHFSWSYVFPSFGCADHGKTIAASKQSI